MEVCDMCSVNEDFQRCKDVECELVMCMDCIVDNYEISKHHNFEDFRGG